MKKAILTILAILIADQWIKIWVKLTFLYGESRPLIPGWFDLQFVENPGMAFGWMIEGPAGKLVLSVFRIIVVIGIAVYLVRLIKEKAHSGFIFCISLIIAGALGNIIDSAVYGLIFNQGSLFDAHYGDYTAYFGLAQAQQPGYAPFLMGNVVDMLHFSKQVTFPDWFPFWAGKTKPLFPPVFNIADSAITAGILSILVWQKRFFPSEVSDVKNETPQASSESVTNPEEEKSNPI